jgi:hypothetical protein
MREVLGSARFWIFVLILLIPLFFIGAYSMQRECDCFRPPCSCSDYDTGNGIAFVLFTLLPSLLLAYLGHRFLTPDVLRSKPFWIPAAILPLLAFAAGAVLALTTLHCAQCKMGIECPPCPIAQNALLDGAIFAYLALVPATIVSKIIYWLASRRKKNS